VVGEEEEAPPPPKPPPGVEEKGRPPGDLPQEKGPGQPSRPQGEDRGSETGVGDVQKGSGHDAPIMGVD